MAESIWLVARPSAAVRSRGVANAMVLLASELRLLPGRRGDLGQRPAPV